ncbi:hypothetical protein J2T57_001688 [Natronocella acetinitrilica]|uniref:Uncharacterized protein n=1 Tax=Natronocella acetinitrilica TaxID=414046 RepID=A0AAE3KBE6_9GAMM|nr:hypothetical protein [Natronocella acetinitrilica]
MNSLDKPSVAASSLIQTLSWKERKAEFVTNAENGVMEQVSVRILPLVGADDVIDQFIA